MIKVIGTISTKDLTKRQERTRIVRRHSRPIGTAIVQTNGLSFAWARCTIKQDSTGALHAVRNGVYVRPVPYKIIKDESFIRL